MKVISSKRMVIKESYELSVKDIPFFSFEKTILSHGWSNLAPFRWDHGEQRLYVAVSADAFSVKGFVAFDSKKQTLIFHAEDSLEKISEKDLYLSLRRIFFLDQDILGLEKLCRERKATHYLKLVQSGWGRILRSPNVWEDAVKTICTTNATWSFTQKMCLNLVNTIGKVGFFPQPAEILSAGEKYMHEATKTGYRSAYIYNLAKKIVDESLNLDKLENGKTSFDEAYSQIRKIKGFGPYGTNHLLILLGFHNVLPLDREVLKYLGIRYENKSKLPFATTHFEEWGPYRFVIYKLDRILKKANWVGD